MSIKTLGIVSMLALVAGASLAFVIHDDADISTIGKPTILPRQEQTALPLLDNTSKHLVAESGSTPRSSETGIQESEKDAKEVTPNTVVENPQARAVATYEIHMMKETRDNQWAQTVESMVEDVIHAPALASLSPVSSECRGTLCRWELASNDEMEAANAERLLVQALAQKDGGSAIVRRIQDPAGSGLRLVVLYARAGYALPTID